MLRRSFGKTLTVVITICLLCVGIAPANPNCTAECCLQPKIHGSHNKAPSADLLANCCSELETAPCPHTLESNSEFKDLAAFAVAPNASPAGAKIAASSNNKFILSQSRPLLASKESPQIRGPGASIYLLTQTFLI